MIYLEFFCHRQIALVVMSGLEDIEKRIVCGNRSTSSIAACQLYTWTATVDAALASETIFANCDELVVERDVFIVVRAKISGYT